MKIDFSNKTVIVTGGTRGIGAAIVELFQQCNAQVIGTGTNTKELERLNQESKGKKTDYINLDFTSNESVQRFLGFIDKQDRVDVLINNAGAAVGLKDILDLDEESWNKTFWLNARAPFFLAQSAFKHMKDNGGGRIINISSISVKYGGSSQTLHYGAAKSALETITLGLSKEGAKHNILVNTVRGGYIETPKHEKMGRKNHKERIDMIPLKKAGKPQDIAGMVLFLASEGGDFITGETFTVAGGD